MKKFNQVLLAAIVLFSGIAEAHQVSSTGTVTGPNGQTATRRTTRSAGNVQSTVTGPNGQSASRKVTRNATSASATVTGPKGKSASRTRTSTD